MFLSSVFDCKSGGGGAGGGGGLLRSIFNEVCNLQVVFVIVGSGK